MSMKKLIERIDSIESKQTTTLTEGLEQGVAEGSDDLIGAVLSVIQDIYNGALAGEEMIDNVADELGDYFDDVKRSKDKTLRRAYQFMRREGGDAEGDPQKMAQVAKQAIDMLSQQGITEGFKNTYSVGDRVDSPLGTGTIVAVSKNINVDGRVRVKLDDPSRAGEDGKYKDSFVLDTTQLKHISEQGVAEGFKNTYLSLIHI